MRETSRSPTILCARVARLAALAAATIGLALPAEAAFLQTNLVSSIPGLATITDPLLINPWGISRSPTSPFWVSNQGTNTSTLYAVTGKTNVSAVTAVNAHGFVGIPTTAAGPQGPTGQVNNINTASFQLTPGTASTSSRFLFADLNGQISGWAGGLSSTALVTTPGAVYTGLAINAAGTRFYAANDAGGGSINVFDSSFASVSLTGAFVDPNLPAGFVPFGIQDLGGKVCVTYAPAGFGEFGGDLLVGNFSFATSAINAFDAVTGALNGSIGIDVGAGNTAGGFWGFMFGSGAGNGGDANTLYFLDGINGETAGLFAAITPVPEPETLPLIGLGLVALGWAKRRKSAA